MLFLPRGFHFLIDCIARGNRAGRSAAGCAFARGFAFENVLSGRRGVLRTGLFAFESGFCAKRVVLQNDALEVFGACS